MPKPRSPILGFNHNLRHRGRSFHVQTEDSGLNSPRIFTHLFHEGVIVASKKVDYDPDSDAEVVKGLMQAQHKAVLRELKRGAYDQKIQALLGGDSAAPTPIVSDPTVKAPTPELLDDEDAEYAQIIVDDSGGVSMVAGTLDAKEDEDEVEVSGAFRRLSSEPRRQITPNPVTVAPANPPRAQGTWMLTRTGQQERPFDKTGPIQAPMPTPVPTSIPPIPTPRTPEGRRRNTTPVAPAPPVKLPEVPTPPPPPLVQRSKRNIPPSGPVPAPELRRPPPPPTVIPSGTGGRATTSPILPTGTGGRATTSPILPVVPPAPRTPSAPPRTTKPTDSIVVARPAVVIGAPAPAGQERKPARESAPPPESIFGQDLISEKSLDEVIMAYLSEDANDD